MTAHQGISREICDKVAADLRAKHVAPREAGRATRQLRGTQRPSEMCETNLQPYLLLQGLSVPTHSWALRATSYSAQKKAGDEQDWKLRAALEE